jgi:hypothetical protein
MFVFRLFKIRKLSLIAVLIGFMTVFISSSTEAREDVDFYCLVDRVRWAIGHAKVQFNLRRSHQELIIERDVERLRSLPKRDLSSDPPSVQFLRDHKIYISITTSPERIGLVSNVIRTLDLTNVEAVLVALPLKYGRNGAEYIVPPELLSMPKVKLLRPEKDLGPATKLLPAADYVNAIDPKSRVITVDDDIGYPNGMINDLIYFSARLPDAAVGTSSAKLSFWGIPATFAKAKPTINLNKAETVTPADVLEGFGAVSYPAGKVDTNLIKRWALSCKECLLSDDLTISMSLQKNGTPRYGIRSSYYNRGSLVQFTYGFGNDALHK